MTGEGTLSFEDLLKCNKSRAVAELTTALQMTRKEMTAEIRALTQKVTSSDAARKVEEGKAAQWQARTSTLETTLSREKTLHEEGKKASDVLRAQTTRLQAQVVELETKVKQQQEQLDLPPEAKEQALADEIVSLKEQVTISAKEMKGLKQVRAAAIALGVEIHKQWPGAGIACGAPNYVRNALHMVEMSLSETDNEAAGGEEVLDFHHLLEAERQARKRSSEEYERQLKNYQMQIAALKQTSARQSKKRTRSSDSSSSDIAPDKDDEMEEYDGLVQQEKEL